MRWWCPVLPLASVLTSNRPKETEVTTETKVEAVAWRVLEIGNRGAAYDPRDAKRAFTYDHQPGNIDASKLGRATVVASLASAGDSIDRGLSLLKALQAEGFGVFQVGQEAQSAITALEGEVAMLRDALHIETHKVITCGVAASHPDASLSRRMEYSGKWDSPQAQQVRALRDKADAAERRVAELENLLTAIRPYAQHADECGDMDAYNNARIESCGCGLDSLLDAVSEALAKETP
jgi:hypothetical protein